MDLQEFVKVTHSVKRLDGGYEFQEIRPRIICADGVSLSVQGSESHYSSPRYNYPSYESMEVGYPSIRPPQEWGQYYDGQWIEENIAGYVSNFLSSIKSAIWTARHISFRSAKRRLASAFIDNATDGVYGYVPVELIEQFIEAHGGIDEEKTFAQTQEG